MDEKKIAAQVEWQKTPEASAARDKERDRVYRVYLSHFGLDVEKDLDSGKEILDVGAGSLAAFADRTRQLNFNCRVVSIDKGEFIDVSGDGIDQGKNLKIGGVDFENLKLAGGGGFKKEPEFDLILSNSGPPYTIVNLGEHIERGERGVERENLELLRAKIEAVIGATLNHLKIGGRAVFYPVYSSEIVDFGTGAGGKKDFRAWRKFLDEGLKEMAGVEGEKRFMYFFEPVSGSQPPCERLIIRRLN